MTDQAQLAWKTLGLSLMVVLPFAAHLYFSDVVEYRAPAAGEIAQLIAEERESTPTMMVRLQESVERTLLSRVYFNNPVGLIIQNSPSIP